MSLSPTDVLRYIELKIGASSNLIELATGSLLDIVKQVSIPTFSTYFPHRIRLTVDTVADAVPGRQGLYYLKTDLRVVGVAKMLTDYTSGMGGLTPNPAYATEDPFTRQMMADLGSFNEHPLTFEWHAPNQVEIHPKVLAPGTILFEVKVHHPSHMATIPENMREEFLKLCVLDVKDAIYQVRSKFASINSPFGSIDLNLDSYSDAESKRDELLERWRGNVLRTPKVRKLYIG
jgi:hypothetical protein